MQKKNLPLLHVQTRAELLDVNLRLFGGTDDTVDGWDFQEVFRFPGVLLSCDVREHSPFKCKEAPLSTLYIRSSRF